MVTYTRNGHACGDVWSLKQNVLNWQRFVRLVENSHTFFTVLVCVCCFEVNIFSVFKSESLMHDSESWPVRQKPGEYSWERYFVIISHGNILCNLPVLNIMHCQNYLHVFNFVFSFCIFCEVDL